MRQKTYMRSRKTAQPVQLPLWIRWFGMASVAATCKLLTPFRSSDRIEGDDASLPGRNLGRLDR